MGIRISVGKSASVFLCLHLRCIVDYLKSKEVLSKLRDQLEFEELTKTLINQYWCNQGYICYVIWPSAAVCSRIILLLSLEMVR